MQIKVDVNTALDKFADEEIESVELLRIELTRHLDARRPNCCSFPDTIGRGVTFVVMQAHRVESELRQTRGNARCIFFVGKCAAEVKINSPQTQDLPLPVHEMLAARGDKTFGSGRAIIQK